MNTDDRDSDSDFYGRYQKYKCSRSNFILSYSVFTVLI